MSKDFIGDLCAYIPKQPGQNKASYHRVGSAFTDSENKQISLKIDTMPIQGSGWGGWLNVFPPKSDRPKAIPPGRPLPGTPNSHFTDMDDDIPF